jgi:N-acetyl-anhydromuramyl-L-alanine amidase AmpD
VPLPSDRLLYQDVQGLATGQLIEWTHHRYLRTVQGHKQIREVEVTAAGELCSWEGFTQAASSYGVPDARLWACLIRDVTTAEAAAEPPLA